MDDVIDAIKAFFGLGVLLAIIYGIKVLAGYVVPYVVAKDWLTLPEIEVGAVIFVLVTINLIAYFMEGNTILDLIVDLLPPLVSILFWVGLIMVFS